MNDAQIEVLKVEVAAMSLGPSDILVVRFPQRLTFDSAEVIRSHLRSIIENKVLVLDSGASIEKITGDSEL